MSRESYKPTRVFTIEEANARLPLVRSIVGDIVELARDVSERRARLNALNTNRSSDESDVYRDELAEVERQLDKDTDRLEAFVRELLDLGVELKSVTDGLVDFPSRQDGKLVYLCWRYNEPEVLFWHKLEAGFAGRKPLTADAVSGSDEIDRLLDQ